MNHGILALAGLALTVLVLAPATAQAAAKTAAAERSPTGQDAAPTEPEEEQRSEAATRVATWVAASGDHGKLPYIIVDKPSAQLILFDAKGKQLGTAPVLLGIALGDEATPGIGSKNLSEIGPAEKTTPAGRFLAKFGVAAGRQRVLWVDYATSVALHPIPPGNPKDRRKERMLSKTIDDNRITYGCINVPKVTHARISTLFRKRGGYVYILPDQKPLEDVFPPLHALPNLSR